MPHFPGYLGFSERIRATSLWSQLVLRCRRSVKESEEGKRERKKERESLLLRAWFSRRIRATSLSF